MVCMVCGLGGIGGGVVAGSQGSTQLAATVPSARLLPKITLSGGFILSSMQLVIAWPR